MEYGEKFEDLSLLSKKEIEEELDRPFNPRSSGKIRIIKSHQFAYQLDFIKDTWPECPILIAERSDDACLGWWVKCGHFDITYPNYEYYKDLKHMVKHIRVQNEGIRKFVLNNEVVEPENTYELAYYLNIKIEDDNSLKNIMRDRDDLPKKNQIHDVFDYKKNDINFYLYWSKLNNG